MSTQNPTSNDLGLTLGMLIVRLWLAMRAIQTGIEKFAGMNPVDSTVIIDGEPNSYDLTSTVMEKTYSLEDYQGVPDSLVEKFSSEPLIPSWGLTLFDSLLGPALILVGVMLLLGLATRFSLFAMGLIYTSLTFGLVLIKQDAGVAWLGIHIILVVAGLALAKYNRFAILKKW